MDSILGYRVVSKFYESKTTSIYRGRAPGDFGESVIMKQYKDSIWFYEAQKNTANTYSRLPRHLHHLPKLLKTDVIEGKAYSIFSDMGGVTVDELRSIADLNIEDCLTIAINLCLSVEELHRYKVVHGNICTDNVIVNPSSRKCQLIDFDASRVLDTPTDWDSYFATVYPKIEKDFCSPEMLKQQAVEGVASDIFALGIVLYDLFTGEKPYRDYLQENSGSESKITPANDISPNVPLAISNIIQKCIHNYPESRYESVAVLREALESHYGFAGSFSTLLDVESDKKEKTSSVSIPIKCRTHELHLLSEAHSRASNGGFELVFLEGKGGVGKSNLVESYTVTKPNLRYQTINLSHISRATDSFQLNSLVNAIEVFVSDLPKTDLEILKERLAQSSFSGRQLCLVRPALTALLGDTNIPTKLNTELLITDIVLFLNLLSDDEYPILLNITSSDQMSQALLNLVEVCFNSGLLTNVIFVLSYDSTKLGPDSYLSLLLRSVSSSKPKGAAIQTHINLSPIDVDVIVALVEDLLYPFEQDLSKLAEIIHDKTDGIPNRVSQYLDFLFSKSLIYRDSSDSVWRWDIEAIKSESRFSSIEDLYESIKPFITCEQTLLLSIFACCGCGLDRTMIGYLCDLHEINNVDRHLEYFVKNDIVSFSNVSDRPTYRITDESIAFKIRNERVDSFRKGVHEEIILGLLSRKHVLATMDIYRVADQMLYSVEEDFVQSIDYIRTAVLAGFAAKHRRNMSTAKRYLEKAFLLIADEHWSEYYSVVFYVVSLYLDVLMASGDHKELEKAAYYLKDNAQGIEDKALSVEYLIDSCKHQDKHSEAIDIARTHLKELGYSLPSRFYTFHIIKHFVSASIRLMRNPEKKLLNLPEAKDPETKAILRLNQKIVVASYQAEPDLLPVTTLKGLIYTLKRGVTVDSVQFVVAFGLIVLIGIKRLDLAFKFHEIGSQLAKRFPHQASTRVIIDFYFNGMIRPWREPLKKCENDLADIFKQSVISREFETAAFTNGAYFANCIIGGHELVSLEKKLDVSFPQLVSLNLSAQIHIHKIIWQAVHNLTTKTDSPTRLVGDIYDEDAQHDFHEEASDKTVSFTYFYSKVFLNIVFKNYADALEYHKAGKKIIKGAWGLPYITMFHLFYTVARVSQLRERSWIKRIIGSVSLIANGFRFRYYRKCSPVNYQHLYDLHMAESYSLIPFFERKAQFHFKRARNKALKLKRYNDAALISERMLAYQESIGKPWDLQNKHIKETVKYYDEAGYRTKRDTLLNEYDFNKASTLLGVDNVTLLQIFQRLMTAQLSLSGLEDVLVEEVCNLLGGSQCLLVRRDPYGVYRVYSQIVQPSGRVSKYKHEYQTFSRCNPRAIKHVLNSQSEYLFTGTYSSRDDELYAETNSVGSILALPLKGKESSLLGVVYVESPDVGAFTDSKVSLAKLIATHAVTCLEMAILYKSKLQSDSDRVAYARYLARNCHELNTPLNTIVHSLRHLQHDLQIPATNTYLLRATEASDHALRLTKDTIDFEKIRNNTLELMPRDFSLTELLTTAFATARVSAEGKPIHLRFPNLAGLYDKYHADPFIIMKVLNNILGNAVKFTNKGFVSCDIEVLGSDKDTERLSFSITNSGDPIPEEYRDKVFTEYTQADSTTTRKHGGWGIGLAMSKELIEYIDGNIYLDNTKPLTTFTFELPLEKVACETFNPVPLEFEDATLLNVDTDNLLEDKIVVVIDDDNDDRPALVETLSSMGAKVHDFDSALSALRFLPSSNCDLVITDIEMPEMDGYRLAKEIRRSNIGDDVPIMAITGHRIGGIEAKCLEAGMNAYIAKPYALESLVTKLVDLLSIDVNTFKVSNKPRTISTDFPLLPNQKHLNLSESIYQLSYSNDRLVSLLKGYRSERIKFPKKIASKIKAKDYKKAGRLAHSLKSAANKIGAFELADLCLTIEMNPNITDDILLSALESEAFKVKDEVDQQLEHLASLGWEIHEKPKANSINEFFDVMLKYLKDDSPFCTEYKHDVRHYLYDVDEKLAKEFYCQLDDSDLDAAYETLILIYTIYNKQLEIGLI